MRAFRFAPHLVLAGLVFAAAAGCDRSDLIEAIGRARPWEGPNTSGALTKIPFVVFSDDIAGKGSSERRVLFKTSAAYEAFFGHPAPALVDFNKEWVIFYAAGTKPTGGYAASVLSLAIYQLGKDNLLQAVTRLESPGPGCAVTDALTTPRVLVKFAAQEAVFNVDFAAADATRDCPPTGGCAAVRCAKGTHCEEEQVVCVRAPCPPIARCVPDAARVPCGGIAGRPCPGAGTCEDDPDDTCDPKNGGADCGGICICRPLPCPSATKMDTSPAVCACVAPQKR